MTDLGFALGVLLLCAALGWPLAQCLPQPALSRWVAAPVLGFAALALGTTLLYRAGASAAEAGRWMLALGLCATAGLLWWRRQQGRQDWRPPAGAAGFLALALLALLLCLAPGWLGGEAFRVFQGNDQDQLNYVAFSSAMRRQVYDALMALTPETATATDYLLGTRKMLLSRPAVCIAFAAMAEFTGRPTPVLAYAWVALLQCLQLFAAAWLLHAALRVARWPAVLGAAALALGFFGQYVLDINAWSELAALPLGLLLLGLLLPPGHARLRRALPAFTLLLAALLHLYPELLLAYGPAGGLVVLARLWRRRAEAWRDLPWLLLAAGLAVLACLPAWESSIGLLLRQQQGAMETAYPWWRHFQGYLFGRDLDFFAATGPELGSAQLLYAMVSLPVDMLAGLTGLYFLLPGPGLPLPVRLAWQLALALGMAGLLASAARRRRGSLPWRRLALLAAGATLPALVALGLGRYWAAGKAWSMVGPLAFLVLAAPALRPGAGRWQRGLALAYLVAHLGLGVWRPLAAARGTDGAHYPPPYPAVPNAVVKRDFNWAIGPQLAALRQCHGISLALSHPSLERYLQVVLTELGVRWSSTTPLNSDFGNGLPLGLQPQLPAPDCLVTTELEPSAAGQRVFWLGRNAGLADFIAGKAAALELVASGWSAPGLHAAEPHAGAWLRWTDGDTRLRLPMAVGPGGQLARLELELWPVRPAGAWVRLEVNGVVLLEEALPDGGAWHRSLPLDELAAAPELRLRLVSSVFQPAGDPRRLGLALRSLVLHR